MELPKIALLGVGLMGRPMARNLARGGVPLTVWNRSAEKCAGLDAEGIDVAPSAAEASPLPRLETTPPVMNTNFDIAR